MRPPRITIRGLMCLVFGVSIALHLSLTAIRVSSMKEYHTHTWVHVKGGRSFITVAGSEQPPFWPRYWRSIIGLTWKGLSLCPQVDGRLLDMCEFAHHELRTSRDHGGYDFHPSQSQIDLQRRLDKRSP